jgi:hypothetical protein
METLNIFFQFAINNSIFLLGFLGPFICCKRKVVVNPPGAGSSTWKVGGGPDSKYGGQSQSQRENAVDDFKNNPDKWKPYQPHDPDRPVGPWTEWYREGEFCFGRFNGWID